MGGRANGVAVKVLKSLPVGGRGRHLRSGQDIQCESEAKAGYPPTPRGSVKVEPVSVVPIRSTKKTVNVQMPHLFHRMKVRSATKKNKDKMKPCSSAQLSRQLPTTSVEHIDRSTSFCKPRHRHQHFPLISFSFSHCPCQRCCSYPYGPLQHRRHLQRPSRKHQLR